MYRYVCIYVCIDIINFTAGTPTEGWQIRLIMGETGSTPSNEYYQQIARHLKVEAKDNENLEERQHNQIEEDGHRHLPWDDRNQHLLEDGNQHSRNTHVTYCYLYSLYYLKC